MFYAEDEESEIIENILSFSDKMENYLHSGLTFKESLAKYFLDSQDYGNAYLAFKASIETNPKSKYTNDNFMALDEIRENIMRTPFFGKKYVITGALLDMEREEALSLIKLLGGKTSDNPVNDMDVLVVGYCEWSELNDGRPTRKILKAQELQQKGRDIRIISDDQFLSELSSVVKGVLPNSYYQRFFNRY